MGLQSHGNPSWRDLDVNPVERSRVYYKGEGGGFPQVRAVVSLVCPCCPWLVLAPKVLQLCTNHLVWVVCRPMWLNETCQLILVPSWSFNTPFYPSKCCELGSVPRLLPLPLSFTWTHIWILQGVGNASHLGVSFDYVFIDHLKINKSQMRFVIQMNPSQPFQHHMTVLWNFDDTKNQHKWKKK
jgi:hypothetical protein